MKRLFGIVAAAVVLFSFSAADAKKTWSDYTFSFPLTHKQIYGYTFGQRTWYSQHHLGVDYRASYNKVYAPADGRVFFHYGSQGGLTAYFIPTKYPDLTFRFMHLSKSLKQGPVKQGQALAVTGNSGSLTTGAHFHMDIHLGNVWSTNWSNYINPEKLKWKFRT